jgi:broad specificity phosphatase PhoE
VPPATILLARHGETDWNRERRIQGHADEPLNEAGRGQARELAAVLAQEVFDAIYASDLARAHETARIVAEHHDLAVTLLPDLRERHFGSWEGLTEGEILQRFPDAGPGHRGDGEAADEMAGRVIAAIHRIAEAHPGGHVLAVAHGGPLRAVLLHCDAHRESPIGNCDVIRITVDRGRIAHAG